MRVIEERDIDSRPIMLPVLVICNERELQENQEIKSLIQLAIES